MKLTDKIDSKANRVIVFGPPKSGKTELVARLSEHFKLLWLDFENGYVVMRKLPREWQERIDVISIPDTKVFPIGIETALKVVTGGPVKICENHGKVTCAICMKESAPQTAVQLSAIELDTIVVFDSLTQISASAMNHLTKNESELYKPEWGDYRNQGQLLDKMLSQIQQAKYNVVCITHETETEMEDGKKKLVPVAGTTNFSRNTAKYFDHVVYCELKNRKHAFSSATTYATNVLTGSRTNVSIESDEVPTLLRIFKPELYSNKTPSSISVSGSVSQATPANTALANLKALVKKA